MSCGKDADSVRARWPVGLLVGFVSQPYGTAIDHAEVSPEAKSSTSRWYRIRGEVTSTIPYLISDRFLGGRSTGNAGM
jgi:hypothetical protein